MKFLKKLFKVCCWTVLSVLVLVLVLVLSIPLWLGPTVKCAANAAVPQLVKTGFRVGTIGINPYSGKLRVADLRLDNPSNFDERVAVSLGALSVDMNYAGCTNGIVEIDDIEIGDLYVSYVKEDGEFNFERIAKNCSGETESEAAENANIRDQASGRAAEQDAAADGEDAGEEPGEEIKIVINRIRLSGLSIRLEWIPVAVPIPTIVLTDIGRESGGLSLEETGEYIWGMILKSAGAAGGGLKTLGKGAAGAAGKAGDVLDDALDSAFEFLEKAADKANRSLRK